MESAGHFHRHSVCDWHHHGGDANRADSYQSNNHSCDASAEDSEGSEIVENGQGHTSFVRYSHASAATGRVGQYCSFVTYSTFGRFKGWKSGTSVLSPFLHICCFRS